MNGEAEPRLTSGGEAGADGVKFDDGRLILKTVLTSGGEAGADGVKFHDGRLILKTVLTSGGEAATKRALEPQQNYVW